MTDDMNKNEGAPIPATPAPQPAPYQATSQQPPVVQQMPPQQQPPMYAPQPIYAPAPLMQLTGGMKFGWLVVGAFAGVVGILIAWLTNVDKIQTVKSDAIKWSLIGFLIGIVLGILFTMLMSGLVFAMMASAFSGMDASYMGHGYSSF